MPDVYLCSIEPPIAIVLAKVCGSDPPNLTPLSLPSLGVSSLDLGRLWQRRRPFFLCAPPIVFRILWGTEQSAGTARPHPFSIFRISVFRFLFQPTAQMLD